MVRCLQAAGHEQEEADAGGWVAQVQESQRVPAILLLVQRRAQRQFPADREKNRDCQYQLAKVDPKNTSRQCPNCGHTSAENRKSQAVFVCTRCGHKAHADTVGAVNTLARAQQQWARTQETHLLAANNGRPNMGSQDKTDPSAEVQPLGVGGTGVEP